MLLWPDTFNNYFGPGRLARPPRYSSRPAIRVELPSALALLWPARYTTSGCSDVARKLLQGILDALRDDIRAGTPLIVLEPSCAAGLPGRTHQLFPHDEDAHRLSRQTLLLSEFLEREKPGFGHCRTSGARRWCTGIATRSP